MTGEQASTAVRAAFRAPIPLDVAGSHAYASRTRIASAKVGPAVAAALASSSGEAVPLRIAVDRALLTRYARRLAGELSRPPRDAQVRLQGLRPRITPERTGTRVDPRALARALSAAVTEGATAPLTVRGALTKPTITRADLRTVVVVQRSKNRLFLYRAGRRRVELGVATGQPAYPTPLGEFTIVDKQLNPWWYPPDSPWAAGMSPIPPGPGNPLGTRWMGLSVPGVGLHGTPDAASIGYSASHGCIRMRIPDAEWLYERVEVGTPVFIVP
jgi:lipoprotein-anchoring transpeptidase ErfK/SrfK